MESCVGTATTKTLVVGFVNALITTLYAADGHVIQTWTSTGKVECTQGGICDFMDAATNKLVRTTGDIVVTVK